PMTSHMFSSGVNTSTFMIGSSNVGLHLGNASRYALRAAISNDKESESTAWNDPSIKRTFNEVNGKPANTPLVIEVSKPFCTEGMDSLAIAPPTISFTNCSGDLVTSQSSSTGDMTNWISANLPRPPVCFLYVSRC